MSEQSASPSDHGDSAFAGPPEVKDADADRRFRERARDHGWDPDDKFVGGYVDWEWRHSRHLFDGLFTSVNGKRVLEFGCHFGGTAIVLAALGAEVTAIDVDVQYVELTRLNAERHGLGDRIRTLHVPDTTRLPFERGEVALVSCNSVLEYVPHDALAAVQREIDRVLAPGGHVVILGTSNRPLAAGDAQRPVAHELRAPLAPPPLSRQAHRERLPLAAQGRLPRLCRPPAAGRRAAPRHTQGEDGRVGARLKALAAANRLLRPLSMHVGYVSPSITMVLEKR